MVGAPLERLARSWEAGVVLLREGPVCWSSLLGRDKLQRDLFVFPTGETCLLVGPRFSLIAVAGACGGSLIVTDLRLAVRYSSTSVGFGFGGKCDHRA